jgi:hypothetical protein
MGLYILDKKRREDLSGRFFLMALSFLYFSGTATYGLAEQSTDYGVLYKGSVLSFRHGVALYRRLLFGADLYKRNLTHPAVCIL